MTQHPYEQHAYEISWCGSLLVRASATMESVLMCSIDNCSLLSLSLTIINLISIYLDFVELLLLLEYNTADLLLQNNLSGLSTSSIIHSPVTKFHSHIM